MGCDTSITNGRRRFSGLEEPNPLPLCQDDQNYASATKGCISLALKRYYLLKCTNDTLNIKGAGNFSDICNFPPRYEQNMPKTDPETRHLTWPVTSLLAFIEHRVCDILEISCQSKCQPMWPLIGVIRATACDAVAACLSAAFVLYFISRSAANCV